MNIEFEIDKITSKTIYTMLKEKIKGQIFVRVFDDVLNVEITHDDFVFTYKYNEWMTFVHYNGDLSVVANDIVKNFKKAVNAKFFY